MCSSRFIFGVSFENTCGGVYVILLLSDENIFSSVKFNKLELEVDVEPATDCLRRTSVRGVTRPSEAASLMVLADFVSL